MAVAARVAGVLLTAFFFGLTFEGIGRKVTARIQRRYGPPWYQNFIDVLKTLTKHGWTHGWIFDFGVVMALGGVIATLAFVPLGNFVAFPGLDNFFVIVYLFTVGALGMAMGMVGTGNPWASIGVARALTLMLGYEVPYLIVITSLLYYFRTSNISTIVEIQSVNGWNLFHFPIGALVAFISLQGMLGKEPFEAPIAPAEIASGPMVELSAKYMGLLMLMNTFMEFVEISLFVDFFLGGGNYFEFLLKYLIVWLLAVMISAVLPRFRIEQAVFFYWTVPLLLAFIQVFLIVAVM
ncbi:respiratory chain complex I subunit 1 family protein [Fervidobacterium thailandense]|uniref:NADH dehydrogenase n=1 Tax=Fervidobacterium thailandense TaxID=1008305 RepID=A0A1E3G3C3_9BACT|nr:NADH-quinone oxidoreductase subunit H [Fervidobacterium thailandense]ODN30662.1 NADH dehydrogenase [Fervidobacterium thailandense]